MAKKKNNVRTPRAWDGKTVELYRGLQFPRPSNPYVFLESLKTGRYAHTRRIGNMAETMLTNSSFYIEPAGQALSNALVFLRQMAESERNKEIKFIEAKLIELEKINVESGKINEIRNFLLTMKNSPSQVDYNKFISIINSLLLDAEVLSGRISDLTKKNNSAELRANLASSVKTLISNYTGTRTKIYYSYEEVIRRLVSQYIEQQDFITLFDKVIKQQGINISPAEIFTIVGTLLQDSLVRFLVAHGKIEYQKGDLGKEKFNSELTRLSKELKNYSKSYEAQNLLNLDGSVYQSIKELFGLNIGKDRVNRGKIASEDLTAISTFKDQSKQFQSDLRRVKVKADVNYSNIALLDEVIKLMSNKGVHTGSRGLAVDGTYIITFPEFEDQFLEQENEVLSQLTNLYNELSASSSPEQVSEKYLQIFSQIENTLKDIKNSFVLHESTKFYLTVEKGTKRAYHGREMNIFNYIQEAAITGTFNQDTLNFMAMNLATDSIGAANKEPLETYLSMFAGLLMFDDFSVVAKQLTNQIPLATSTHLHFYRLQDLYFPSSYFLQMTADKMEELQTMAYAEESYNTHISVPTINYYQTYYSDGKSNIPMEQRWEEVRERADKNTKIRIAFGVSFLDMVKQLEIFDFS